MSLENLKTIESISLDFYNNNIKTINVKQLDTKSRYVKISCTEHGKFCALNPETMSVIVRCKKPDGFYVLNNCDILSDGTILLKLTQQMLAVAGKCTVDITILYTDLKDIAENGNVELSEEHIALAYEVSDDNDGNVIFALTQQDEEPESITIESIEDLCKLNIPVLSTMTFYINVLPTAVEHALIASSYEYDALLQGIENQKLVENHMKAQDEVWTAHEDARETAEALRNTAEETRISNESLRISNEETREANEVNRKNAESQRAKNEATRETNEEARINAENTRISNENERIGSENTRKSSEAERVTNELTRQDNEASRVAAETQRQTQTSEAIAACETATANAIQETTKATSATANAVQATTDAQVATQNAESATQACIEATNNASDAITRCDTATTGANEAAALCQSVVDHTGVVLKTDIANNLETSTVGSVLDATQGAALYQIILDLESRLQEQIDNKHDTHYIVEQGTDGIWTYRKWNNGIAECWGTTESVTVAVDEVWGNVYAKDAVIQSVSYPFEFISTPKVQASPVMGDGWNFWLYASAKGTITATPAYGVARGTTGTVSASADLYVIGNWKELTEKEVV